MHSKDEEVARLEAQILGLKAQNGKLQSRSAEMNRQLMQLPVVDAEGAAGVCGSDAESTAQNVQSSCHCYLFCCCCCSAAARYLFVVGFAPNRTWYVGYMCCEMLGRLDGRAGGRLL